MTAFVIGNVAVDETFAVERMPREGESIFGRRASLDLGGKGANQAVNIARAGVPTRLVAAIGADWRGGWIRARLAAEGLGDAGLLERGEASDTSVILTDAAGANAIVTTTEAVDRLGRADVAKALAAAEAGDVLVLQGNLSLDVTRAALELGRRAQLATVFNPSPLRPGFATLLPLVDLVVVNRGEALELTGAATPEAAAPALRSAGAGAAIVTLGAEGALLETAAGRFAVPGLPADAVDTTGAGDTFAGVAVASAMLRGAAIDRRAVEDAVAAAAITVSRRGTGAAFPTREELRAILAAPPAAMVSGRPSAR